MRAQKTPLRTENGVNKCAPQVPARAYVGLLCVVACGCGVKPAAVSFRELHVASQPAGPSVTHGLDTVEHVFGAIDLSQEGAQCLASGSFTPKEFRGHVGAIRISGESRVVGNVFHFRTSIPTKDFYEACGLVDHDPSVRIVFATSEGGSVTAKGVLKRQSAITTDEWAHPEYWRVWGDSPGMPIELDIRPSRARRTKAEAKEAFRRLTSAPWESREERERLSLIVYNAEQDGADVCEEALLKGTPRERDLAMLLLSREATAEEGWHRYQNLWRSGTGAFEEATIRHIGIFINAPAPDLYMLDHIFLGRVAMQSGGAEDDKRVRDHPLLVWYEKHRDKLGQYQTEDENVRQEIVSIWREWAEDNAASFAATLRDYYELTQKIKKARWPNRQEP